ncbi:MAG: hypothetical protein IRZ03_18450 [Acidobacterium ailaaui]|nr:hypothetical protein [Pseudacidobacterium ailaaui]
MKQFISSIFKDVDGQYSSKRVITFAIAILIIAIAIGNSFFGYKVDDNIWSDLIYTLWAGLGMVTSEKFTKRGISSGTEKEVNSK